MRRRPAYGPRLDSERPALISPHNCIHFWCRSANGGGVIKRGRHRRRRRDRDEWGRAERGTSGAPARVGKF